MTHIDVVVTALRRPKVFELMCLSFFGGRIRGLPKIRMILNIDPLGEGDSNEVVQIAHRFADQLIVNRPAVANFSTAINWCFEHVQGDIALHLEDDWILLDPIDWSDWVEQLIASEAAQVSLVYKKKRVGSQRYSFRPNLFQPSFLSPLMPVPLDENPEKYIASQLGYGASEDHRLYPQVRDIGRKWAKGNNLRKGADKDWFDSRKAGLLGKLDWQLAYRYYCFLARNKT